jgi:hypothetical protein
MTRSEPHDLALDVAHGDAERMRAVRAGNRDEAPNAPWMPRGKRQSDHRAIRCADEGLRAADAERVEDGRDRVRLVRAGDGQRIAEVGPDEPVDRQHASTSQVDRAAVADDVIPPAGIAASGTDVTIGRDAALHVHPWCVASPKQRPAHAHVAHAIGMHRPQAHDRFSLARRRRRGRCESAVERRVELQRDRR